MEILVGIGVLLILIAVIVFEIYCVKTIKEFTSQEVRTEERPQEAKLTKEQIKKQEELRKAFENLMGYGYDDALKKKE